MNTTNKNELGIALNSKAEDLALAKRLLKEYQEKGDQRNIEICLRNIKAFS